MGFFLVMEIKSCNGVVHFKRWRIIETPWFNIGRIGRRSECRGPAC